MKILKIRASDYSHNLTRTLILPSRLVRVKEGSLYFNSIRKIYILLKLFYFINSPFIRINCYKDNDWSNKYKDEIFKAIKNCLEVFFIYFLKIEAK